MSFAFATSGVSISALCHFPFVSSTRLCVDHSAQRVASQQSLSPPAQSAHTALSPPPLSPSLSRSLVLPLHLTPSHLLSDLYCFQAFPSAHLFLLAPLIAACCTANKSTASFCVHSLLTRLSLLLFFPHSFWQPHVTQLHQYALSTRYLKDYTRILSDICCTDT